MSIEVYSLDPKVCMGCRATERHLDRMGVEYTIHRLDQGASLPQHIDAQRAPVVVYEGGYHTGHRPDLLNSLA